MSLIWLFLQIRRWGCGRNCCSHSGYRQRSIALATFNFALTQPYFRFQKKDAALLLDKIMFALKRVMDEKDVKKSSGNFKSSSSQSSLSSEHMPRSGAAGGGGGVTPNIVSYEGVNLKRFIFLEISYIPVVSSNTDLLDFESKSRDLPSPKMIVFCSIVV